MISGWGEGTMAGISKIMCLRIYVYIACLVTMARYCSLCTSYSFAKARERRLLHSASFTPVLFEFNSYRDFVLAAATHSFPVAPISAGHLFRL